ncbi:MAG TPA: GNAT family N-acetyltransferase, partial [Gammaproteobacteria bacterium]|nr:GNAT family N-acetyltransferase [Gammaproteobacteria bacterium]
MAEEHGKLIVRRAIADDVDGIVDLVRRAYPKMSPYSRGMVRGQIHVFPDGVFVATYDDEIVGYCATICLPEKQALAAHTWAEATGGGFGSTHDEDGEYLYGYEICVDPEMRRYRIGKRFYTARRQLAESLELKGIVIAGRMPGYERRRKDYATPQAYVDAVLARKVRDPVIGFQLRNGFEVIGVLEGYLPVDHESGGSACHMVWRNPKYSESASKRSASMITGTSNRVRIATVQYGQRRIRSFEEFQQMFL